MTISSTQAHSQDAARTAGKHAARPRSPFESRAFLICLAVFIGVAVSWSTAVSVWRTNRFFDTDDAMRLVQVRDWLAGQGWFDLTERRLDPPFGTLMHWTRIVDVPLAALIRFFALFTNPDAAERMTRLAYPVILQACLFALLYWTARRLAGFRGAAFAVIAAAFSVGVLVQFAPGRITHHNVQIVLLAVMIATTIDAQDAARARSAAVAAAAAALSLAVSLEDLPFIAAMVAVFGLSWIVRGGSSARPLAWFGGGLCIFAPLAFAMVVPPWRYGITACDAYSPVHLVPLCLGGGAFLAMAAATRRIRRLVWRALICAAAGALVLSVEALAFRSCLGDPYVAVDPLVRSHWLSHVTEAEPLGRVFATNVWRALAVGAPILLGAAFALVTAWCETGLQRARWLTLAAFLLMGAFGAFWEVIVATYIAAFAPLGALRLFERPLERGRGSGAARLLAPAALCLAMTPLAWAAPDIALRSAQEPDKARACLESAAFTALRALPQGLILGPIDSGPYVLAFTRDSVLDGPYHRDNRGNRLAIEAFLGADVAAQDKVRESGARYVMICPQSEEMALDAKLAPGGLAARLLDGDAPSWLRPIPVAGTPLRVFEVK